MMEEIDLFDQEIAPNPLETNPSSHNNSGPSNNTTEPTYAEPLRLPRTTGNGRVTFLRDTLQSQIPTAQQLQNTKKQAGKVLKGLGSQLGKLNLGKLIDKMEQDQGLADSLEQLNERMKEEVERQEVRREAEELTLRVITDHLGEFLLQNPIGTYEEWIQDLHPENANQGQLLSDIQQIDERFYVMESDHRKLWNEAIERQEQEANSDSTKSAISYKHRIVEARTQIWGKAPGAQSNVQSPNNNSGYTDNNGASIDLLSGSNPPNTSSHAADPFGTSPNLPDVDNNGIEEIDFFAPVVVNPPANDNAKSDANKDPFQDLIQF